MAKQILIETKYVDNASSGLTKTGAAAETLGKKAKKSMNDTTASVKQASSELGSLGSRLRYLSLVVGIISAGSIQMVSGFVSAARESEDSILKLTATSIKYSQSQEKAKQAAVNLASSGFITLAEASTMVSNVMMTGLGIDKTEQLLKQALGTTILYKQNLTDTVGSALTKFTVGLRVNRETLIDSIGVENAAQQVWSAYAATINKTSKDLTIAEKQFALINQVFKQTAGNEKVVDVASQTFSGTLSRLTANTKNLQIVLGESIAPTIGTLAEILNTATSSLTKFATAQPVLTGGAITGATAVLTLVAAFAAVGAITPMITTGIKLTTSALATMATTSLLVIGKFVLIAAAIGGLIYLVMKATGQWDKWTNSMASLADKIAQVLSPIEEAGDEVTEAQKKIEKQLKSLQDNMNMTTRDFVEGMKEWVDEHDKTIKDLKDQINDLKDEYTEATDKIKSDFKSAMDDINLNHSRKTEDIQRDLNDEVSKGIWADQTKIRDLELSLKRENEDYAISTAEKTATMTKGLADEEKKRSEKITKLQTDLDEELKLENDHAVLVAKARTWPILDEIDKRTRAFNERIAQYQEEREEILNTSSTETTELDNIILKYDQLNDQIVTTGDSATSTSQKIVDSLNNMKKQVDENSTASSQLGTNARNLILTVLANVTTLISDKWKSDSAKFETTYGGSDPVRDFFSNLLGFKEGGIIPGATNQAVPILAHGGETVLPAGVSPMNINIMNPTVRSDEDITKIANAVKDVLSREQMFKKFK